MPISAIVFGGRRREVAPLVYEARDWQHGVLVGAGGLRDHGRGHRRRRRRAPRPDGDEAVRRLQLRRLLGALAVHGQAPRRSRRGCSTSTGSAATRRANSCGPGYGDNLRVMAWILERCEGQVRRRTIRRSATCRRRDGSISRASTSTRRRCRNCSRSTARAWRKEAAEMREYLEEFRRRACRRAARAKSTRLKSRLEGDALSRLKGVGPFVHRGVSSGPSSQKKRRCGRTAARARGRGR